MSPHGSHKIDLRATLYMIVALLFWGAGPNFVRYFTGYFDSWSQNLFRYVAASLVWLPYLLISIRRGRVDPCTWRRTIIVVVPNIIMQSLWVAAIYRIEPGFMNLLNKSSLLWVLAFSMIFWPAERTLLRSRRFWWGLVLSVVGLIGVVTFKSGFTAAATVAGIILTFGASAFWATYTICARIAFKNIDSRTGFAVNAIYTTIGLAILAAIFGRPLHCAAQLPLHVWIIVALSGIFCIAVAHVLFYSAIKRVGATIPSLSLLLTPFIVLTISNIAFGETLEPAQWFFGIILLTGAALAIWSQTHLARPKPPKETSSPITPTPT